MSEGAGGDAKPEGANEPITIRVRDQVSLFSSGDAFAIERAYLTVFGIYIHFYTKASVLNS